MCGNGKMVYADGHKYDGEWADDAYNGRGTLWQLSGRVVDTEWEHGKQKQYSVHGWSSPGTRNARGREPKSINVISQRDLITPYGLQELGHLSSLSGRMGQNAVGTSTTKFLKI